MTHTLLNAVAMGLAEMGFNNTKPKSILRVKHSRYIGYNADTSDVVYDSTRTPSQIVKFVEITYNSCNSVLIVQGFNDDYEAIDATSYVVDLADCDCFEKLADILVSAGVHRNT